MKYTISEYFATAKNNILFLNHMNFLHIKKFMLSDVILCVWQNAAVFRS